MAKKASALAVEPAAEPAPPVEPAKAAVVEPVVAAPINGNVAVVDPPVEVPIVVPPTSIKPAPIAPVVPDDDMLYAIQIARDQLIKSVDPSLKDRFWAENEGKSLKQKAAWIATNKVIAAPNPEKGLPKGPPGGEKPFSVVDFSNGLIAKRK